MKFGENLKSLRKSKNISQEVLADKVGVSRQSVSKWETGEAYPEMNNIIALCTIFKCNINDLVNNNMIDLDSLDDDVKMSVVKFEKEKQEKMKGFSKAIYIIARIFKIISRVGIVFAVIATSILFVLLTNVKFDTVNNKVEVFDHTYDYVLNDDELIINNFKIATNFQYDEKDKIINFMNESSKQIGFISVLSIFLIVSLIFTSKLFETIEKLFLNIHNNETPFTLENVSHIKKISLYLLIITIMYSVVGTILELISSLDIDMHFSLSSYLYIAIIYVLSYIFDYGYQIQLDSNGKMYDDVES